MALIHCCQCKREIPDRAELCPYCGSEPIKVRGFSTIVLVTVVGLVLGLIGGLVGMAIRGASGVDAGPAAEWLLMGACYGSVAGAVAGAFFWAIFPYKGLTRPVPSEAASGSADECFEGCDDQER